jgi:quinol---cytochrome-c reductase cytochrome c subunit
MQFSELSVRETAQPGEQHSYMVRPSRIRLRRFAVGARVGFAALFLLSVCATAQQAAPANPEGKAVFEQRCAKCHGEHGEGVSGALSAAGPNLQAEHDWGTVISRVWVGKGMMPAFGEILTIQEIKAVTGYVTQDIAVIPMGGGDLGKGGELFREHCAPCHRTAVRGGALVFTGVNAPSLVGISPQMVAGAIRWGPGPMPRFTRDEINDQDLQSIVKYVEFAQHPPSPGGTPMNFYGPVAEGFVAWVIIFGMIGVAMWIEKGGKG